MRQMNLLALLVFAVLAFSLFFVAAAFAAETLLAEWLLNSVAVVSDLAETRGELLLEDLNNGAAVLCSFALDRFLEGDGFGLITEVLTLGGARVALGGAGLRCIGEGSCVAEEDAELWPEQLPWLSQLILFPTSIIDRRYATGWYILCLAVIILNVVEEECVAEGSMFATDKNVAEGVEEEFNLENEGEEAKCGGGTVRDGMIASVETTIPAGGGTLSVSSE
jgi:hypothetical protein